MFGLFKKLNAKGEWRKVSELSVGMEIAVPRRSAADVALRVERQACLPVLPNDQAVVEDLDSNIAWDEIVSITHVGQERVYDIEVEGTHNFIGGHYLNMKTGESLTMEQERAHIRRIDLINLIDLISKQGLSPNEPTVQELAKRLGIENLDIGNCLDQLEQLEQLEIPKDAVFGGIFAHNTYLGGNLGVGYDPSTISNGVAAINGNLGIGTATPVAKLSLQGTAGANDLFDLASSTGTSVMRVTSTGNVGIGTTTPQVALSVVGSVSVSPGTTAREISTVNVVTGPTYTNVYGRYAYVASLASSTLAIIDIANPLVPVQIATSSIGYHPRDFAVYGRYAYYTSGDNSTYFRVLDISNPKAVVEVGSVQLTSAVAGVSRGFAVNGKNAYIVYNGSMAKLQTLDISDPASPKLVNTLTTASSTASLFGFAISGRYGYSADYNGVFYVFDLSNPSAPVEVATTTMAGTGTYNVYATDRYAYTVNYTTNNVSVIDVSNPSAPSEVATIAVGSGPRTMALSGRYGYVGNRTGNTITVVDFSNPLAPRVVNTVTAGTGPYGLFVSGRYLYASNYDANTMSIFDISGMETTSLIAHSSEVGTLQVLNSLNVKGSAILNNGLFVGPGGLLSAGPLSVQATNTPSYFGGQLLIGTTSTSSMVSIQSLGGINPFNIASSTGTSLLRVTAAGYVGIGTTSPASLLQVAGNIELGSKGVATAPYLIFNTGSTTNQTTVKLTSTTTLASSYILTLPTTTPSAGKAVLTDASGNLYWGTAGGASASGTAGAIQFAGAAGALNANDLFFFDNTNRRLGIGSTTPIATLSVVGQAGSADLLRIASSSGAQLLTVTAAGKVGIGTTSPSDLLHINTGSGSIQATMLLTSAPDQRLQFAAPDNGGQALITSAYGLKLISGANYHISLLPGTGGNVGIGTTSPGGLLSLQGSATVQDLFRVSSTTGATIFNLSWYGGLVQNIASTTAVSIQNGSGSQVFTVDTTQSAANAGLDITAGGSQTGNLLNFYSSGGTQLLAVTSVGGISQNISSTTAVQILNGSGVNVFNIDTVNSHITIATTASTSIATILVGEGDFAIGDDGLTGTTDGRIWLRSRGTTFRFNSDGNTADYSEFFYKLATDTPETGTVMMADNSTSSPAAGTGLAKVAISSSSYSSLLLGVVTDRGTGYNNADDTRQFSPNFVNIGLLGHVAIKITTENGSVKVGDYLTASAEFPGYAMKAVRSGYVVGVALEDFDGTATSTIDSATSTPTGLSGPVGGRVAALIKPGFQIINNIFVLGENDGQLISATSTSGVAQANNLPSFVIDQKGSGNILQLQASGQDRFLVATSGSISILADITSSAQNVLVVQNASTTLFTINSVGDVTTTGHIIVGKDTAGTATIRAGDNQTTVTFAAAYNSVPKVVVTAQGLPDFFYGVTFKDENGFIVTMSKAASADITFDWIALAQPEETESQSSINLSVVSSPISSIAPITSATPADSGTVAPQSDSGQIAGTSTPLEVSPAVPAGQPTSSDVGPLTGQAPPLDTTPVPADTTPAPADASTVPMPVDTAPAPAPAPADTTPAPAPVVSAADTPAPAPAP